jgi:hypothetical protein
MSFQHAKSRRAQPPRTEAIGTFLIHPRPKDVQCPDCSGPEAPACSALFPGEPAHRGVPRNRSYIELICGTPRSNSPQRSPTSGTTPPNLQRPVRSSSPSARRGPRRLTSLTRTTSPPCNGHRNNQGVAGDRMHDLRPNYRLKHASNGAVTHIRCGHNGGLTYSTWACDRHCHDHRVAMRSEFDDRRAEF